MRKLLFSAGLTICLITTAFAQMSNGKFGNEWINYNRTYLKIPIAQDGVYRIPFAALAEQGLAANSASNFQLYAFGEMVPLHVGENFIEFFGRRNRNELDRFLFPNGERDQLNPTYSLFTDTAIYFLTIASNEDLPGQRYRTVQNDLANRPAREQWYWETQMLNLNISLVDHTVNSLNESTFQRGEGYGLGFAASRSLVFTPTEIFTEVSAPARFDFRLVSRGAFHQLEVLLNNEVVVTDEFSGIQLRDIVLEKPVAALSVREEVIVRRRSDAGTDTYGIGMATLTYPRRFRFNNQRSFAFRLTGNGEPKYLEIENFLAEGVAPILYDLTAGTRQMTTLEGNRVLIKIEAFEGEREFFLFNPNTGVTNIITGLSVKNFTNYHALNGDYIIITSRKLRSAQSSEDQITAYAEYRRNTGFAPVVLEVEDLYDVFAYGVQRHPLAIRNAIHFAKNFWTNPRYVLLIGKGRVFSEIRNYTAAADATFFVPTFGSPGADNLLAATLNSQVPVIPIGRIAATRPSDIRIYLEKLRQYENPTALAAEDRFWRKQVVHLGGGKNDLEQLSIESNMNAMRNIISRNFFGGEVYSYYKRSNNVIQRLDSDEMNNLIQRQGVGIITFFGHGGPTVIDISIGDPATFTNTGRYPVMFVMGCDAGNIHINGVSFSENFVFQSNRAGIALVGTASLGIISSLGGFQRDLYAQLGEGQYGRGLGDAMQAAIRQNDTNSSINMRTQVQQYTLHGDPALAIAPGMGPDYFADRRSVRFQPNPVSLQQDSLELNFEVLNAGKNIRARLPIEIVREFPNGATTLHYDTITAPEHRSPMLRYRFPVGETQAVGQNRFYVRLNKGGAIEEQPLPEALINNELTDNTGNRGVSLFIVNQGATLLDPPPYGIVGAQPVRLTAATANPFERELRYRMQIDTSATFNSPWRRDTIFFAKGGLLTWQPRLSLTDSMVYYWRLAMDSLIGTDFNWQTSSFTYLNNSGPGWRQGHFGQLQNNEFKDLQFSPASRRLQFAKTPTNAQFSVFTYPFSGFSTSIFFNYASINGSTNQYVGRIGEGGVIICVFDDATGNPWENIFPGKFGSTLGERWASPLPSFPFSTRTPEARRRVINFLTDTIPDGHYILLYTIQHANSTTYEPEKWPQDSVFGKTLIDVLAANGATKIQRAVSEGARPYAILYRKGTPSPLFFEELAATVNDTVSGNFNIPGFKERGSMTSVRIGPARKWERWQQFFTDVEAADEIKTSLYGITANGAKTLLINDFNGRDTSLTAISAAVFPYLELQYNPRDSVRRTPSQLGYWQVLYKGLPDAALNPLASDFRFQRDTLQEGETLELDLRVANVSNFDLDSLWVRYSIIGSDNRLRTDSLRLAPLRGQQHTLASVRASTKGLRGKCQLIIEVNPNNQPTELYRFNNVGLLEFYVIGDRRNPLIDVTFDGVRIMNGDLVAAKPYISVTLRDENRFLPLTDTSAIQMRLKFPGEAESRAVPRDSLQFESKTDSKGTIAQVTFTPTLTKNGRYTLIVNGRDASDNRAGNNDYQIEFEVITESRLSNVLNYPNPFSTGTQFVYTLTGSEPPARYTIQIMTVSGRIVRELTEMDLGPLRIGTHRTDYAWNGTDQFGDRLANGVYLYRVIIKDQNGKPLEKFDNGTDRFFKNSVGKLVILR